MSTRIKIDQVEPAAYTALYALSSYVNTTRLPAIQKELIKIRASQINGCAYCIDMHTQTLTLYGQ
jgi:AhpD family alkylhydroperoxidase